MQKALRTYENAAEKEPALFPPDSKTGDTHALPAIWEDDNLAYLDARFKKFGEDAKAALASIKDEASLRLRCPACSITATVATRNTIRSSSSGPRAPQPLVRTDHALRIAYALALAAVLVAAAGAAAWWVTVPRGVGAAVARDVAEPGATEAGRDVFFIAGCELCHMSPGQRDPLRLGGGMERKRRRCFVRRILPDPVDGIGKWSAENFANALMAGVSPLGEHLYPAFPDPSHCRMSIKDVRDLFAFLRTLPPVSGRAPPNALIFPFSIRRAVGFWKLLYMPTIDHPLAVDPTDEEALGRYLVSGTGALRGVPFAPRFSRRNHRLPPADRRPAAGRQGQGAQHHRARSEGLVGERMSRRALDRVHPVGRRARRPDGGGGAEPLPGAGARPRRDRPLPEDVEPGAAP